MDRCQYVLDWADRAHGLNRPEHRWDDMFDTVMVDESWFYLTRVDNKVMVLPETDVPNHPTAKHKSHIEKVMFLVAVARPRTFADGTHFDGKIGLWPCSQVVLARRNSVNRPAGTPEVNYPSDALNHIWGHRFDCWSKILEVDGSNQYKAPHTGGRLRHNLGVTSVNLIINVDLYNRVHDMLHP